MRDDQPHDAVRSGAQSATPDTKALEVLFGTVQDLTSTLESDEVIGRLLKRVLFHLDSEIVSIMLLDEQGSLRISHSEGLPREVAETTCLARGEGISGYVAQSGAALLIEDVEHDGRFQRRNHERYYTRSAISVPLRSQGGVMGVINVNNKRSREPYALSDLHLMEAIAGHAAVALSNASRYEETLLRARSDSLTGLANHGHFYATLEAEVARASRYERALSLVMIDADHFKAWNDRHGHVGGDEALVAIARLIRGGSRVHDLAARYGGEEFAVILPETPLEGAVTFAEKIRQTVAFEAVGPGQAGELTVSAGVATYPGEAGSATELVELADRRLYEAKDRGRNRVVAAG